MSNAPAKVDTTPAPATIEDVLMRGDLSKLTPQQRIQYNMDVCNSLGLNWRTRPFEFITLGGKLVFYARRDAADQLRKINGISVDILNQETTAEGLRIVTVRATDKSGRADTDIGVVNIKNLVGEFAANAMMKAITKAKRRVTLSISGLGLLDETEVGADEPTGEVIGQDSLNILIRECDETGTDKRKLCKYFGVPSMADLTPDQFAEAMAQLKRKRQAIEDGDAQGEALL
jgi:hypothetical protein